MFINNRDILKAHNERALASDLFSIDNRKPWTFVFEESSLKPLEKTTRFHVIPCLNFAERCTIACLSEKKFFLVHCTILNSK